MKKDKQFLTGAEVAVRACFDAGAQMMYGYPITPATEVFTGWIKNNGNYLQTEDEIAAGFAVCGAVLAGQKAFTATSGPGNILMQDSLSMAEGMRLPFVEIVAQRGGPSSGTVIYSQQEVTLSCFGGNGEGMRLVYSPSNLSELYEFTLRAFNESWRYRFPAIVLTDGYMLKTKGVIELPADGDNEIVPAHPLVGEDKVAHWQNIYTFEEELHAEIKDAEKDYLAVAEEICGAETYETAEAEILLIAHGIVGAAAKEAVKELRAKNKKIGLFRPLTLRPFPARELNKTAGAKSVKKIVTIESSSGQLARLVRDELAPEISVPFETLEYPGLGIETDVIIKEIERLKN